MPRHHHQPPSYLQQRAELSQFDDGAVREKRAAEQAAFDQALALQQAAREAGAAAGGVAIGAVPGQDGVVYEPSHHAADYAGLVSRDYLERAHFEAPREAVARSEEGGIVPAPHASTFDIVAGRGDRRHFQDDVRFQSREASGAAPLLADPTFYVPGGQDDRYLSTSMAANARLPTGADRPWRRRSGRGTAGGPSRGRARGLTRGAAPMQWRTRSRGRRGSWWATAPRLLRAAPPPCSPASALPWPGR